MDGFETVACVGQGARDDYAHGVIEVSLLHFAIDVYGFNQTNFH